MKKTILAIAGALLVAGCASDIIPEDWWNGMQSYYNGLQTNRALVVNVTQQSGNNFVYAHYYSSAQPTNTAACVEALKACIQGTQDDDRLQPGGCRIVAVNDKWNGNRDDFAYDNQNDMALLAGLTAGFAQGAASAGYNARAYQLNLESMQAANNYNSRGAFDPKVLPAICH